MNNQAAQALRALDNQLDLLRGSHPTQPPQGWVRAIRDALSMSSRQFGLRLGVVQSRVIAIEQAEVAGAATLRTMQEAAEALGCDFVYALVPKVTLAQTLDDQISLKAREEAAFIAANMRSQGEQPDEEELFEFKLKSIAKASYRKLWDR